MRMRVWASRHEQSHVRRHAARVTTASYHLDPDEISITIAEGLTSVVIGLG